MLISTDTDAHSYAAFVATGNLDCTVCSGQLMWSLSVVGESVAVKGTATRRPEHDHSRSAMSLTRAGENGDTMQLQSATSPVLSDTVWSELTQRTRGRVLATRGVP